MAACNLTKLFRIFALLLALFSISVHAREEQTCEKVMNALRVTLPIGPDDAIRASACKLWPDDKTKMLVAIAFESATQEPESQEMQIPYYVALVNAETFQVLSRYKSVIEQDATTDIHGSSLWLDTARYFLKPDTRAFGLRVSSFHDRCTYEGGSDNALTLFVIDGFTMRPVLQDLYLSSWRYEGNRCGDGEVSEKRVDLTLSVEPTRTNGYADLMVTAKSSDNKKWTVNMRYNGKQYSPIPYAGSFLE